MLNIPEMRRLGKHSESDSWSKPRNESSEMAAVNLIDFFKVKIR